MSCVRSPSGASDDVELSKECVVWQTTPNYFKMFCLFGRRYVLISMNIISKMHAFITNPRMEPSYSLFCHPNLSCPAIPNSCKRLTRVHGVTIKSVYFSEQYIKNACFYHKPPNGTDVFFVLPPPIFPPPLSPK